MEFDRVQRIQRAENSECIVDHLLRHESGDRDPGMSTAGAVYGFCGGTARIAPGSVDSELDMEPKTYGAVSHVAFCLKPAAKEVPGTTSGP